MLPSSLTAEKGIVLFVYAIADDVNPVCFHVCFAVDFLYNESAFDGVIIVIAGEDASGYWES